MQPLEELLSEIESITVGDNWEMSLDDVLVYSQIPREDVMRAVYSQRRLKMSLMEWESFGPGNCGDLVFILGACGWPDASSLFRSRGYYLSEDDRAELVELFLSVTTSRLKSRPVNREELETALAGSRDFSGAVDFYCRTIFDPEELVEFAVRLYLERKGIEISAMSLSTSAREIQSQFHRRSLRWEDLFASITEELRARAIQWKLDVDNADPLEDIPADARQALAVMGFPQKRLPAEREIKARYRKLIKEAHPDVNPHGLERTRSLNASYSVLMACSRVSSR